MKKIIHLSDLHVGYKNTSSKFSNIVTNIITLKQPASKYVIVISGDLVDDGTALDTYFEASGQIARLKSAGFKVLVCPGNHDLGPGPIAYPEVLPYWNEHFLGKANISYPVVDYVDNMAFIGLNSMAAELGPFDRISAEGELGKKQLRALRDVLARKRVRNASRRIVYLHHHPFDTKLFLYLKDTRRLGKVLRRSRIDAILYGHYHDGHVWNGHWNIPCALDAGTSTRKKGARGPHRVIDLSNRKRPTFYDGEFLRM